jgi:hypothetical protein
MRENVAVAKVVAVLEREKCYERERNVMREREREEAGVWREV